MRKRQATSLGVGAGLVLAFLAHFVYWYLPRERVAVPSEEARRTLASRTWDLAAWMPYPHQNLAIVERRIGNLRRWLALVAGDQGTAARNLPSLGPWLLPPARELVVAIEGAELAIDLAVYPTVGWIARMSGRLAGNPWLAGGEVPLGSGRLARIEWDGRRWRLRTAGVRTSATESALEPPGAVLAWLRLGKPLGRLPAGRFRLERSNGTLELRAGRLGRLTVPPLVGAEPSPAAWLAERRGRRGLLGIVVWEDEGAAPPFPAALAFWRGAEYKQRLPGEELLRVAGGEPATGLAAGLSLRALTRREIARGAPLAVEIGTLFAKRRRLSVWAGVRPRRLANAAGRLAAELRGLPLGYLLGVEPEQLAHLLAPLGGCSASVLEVWESPPAARWRICLDEPAAIAPR